MCWTKKQTEDRSCSRVVEYLQRVSLAKCTKVLEYSKVFGRKGVCGLYANKYKELFGSHLKLTPPQHELVIGTREHQFSCYVCKKPIVLYASINDCEYCGNVYNRLIDALRSVDETIYDLINPSLIRWEDNKIKLYTFKRI